VGAQKLAALDGIVVERNDRTYGRSCSGTFSIWLFRTRDGDRDSAFQRAAHVVAAAGATPQSPAGVATSTLSQTKVHPSEPMTA
jgi:hypothetical protein